MHRSDRWSISPPIQISSEIEHAPSPPLDTIWINRTSVLREGCRVHRKHADQRVTNDDELKACQRCEVTKWSVAISSDTVERPRELGRERKAAERREGTGQLSKRQRMRYRMLKQTLTGTFQWKGRSSTGSWENL